MRARGIPGNLPGGGLSVVTPSGTRVLAPGESATIIATAPTTAHPTPSAMAREAYPDYPDDTEASRLASSYARAAYAAGVAAERARIVAWLLAEAGKAQPPTATPAGVLLWAANDLGAKPVP